MNYSTTYSNIFSPFKAIKKAKIHPSLALSVIILTALLFFEMFNYSTTEVALKDLLGNLQFLGIPWSTLLTGAFCGIDFAGLARMFINEPGERKSDSPKETWYLFAAWLLASGMNALLTWWGVSMAIADHTINSSLIISPSIIHKTIPVFVAIMVWVIRILIIGTISKAGARFFGLNATKPQYTSAHTTNNNARSFQKPTTSPAYHPMTPRPATLSSQKSETIKTRTDAGQPSRYKETQQIRPEPTYHRLSV